MFGALDRRRLALVGLCAVIVFATGWLLLAHVPRSEPARADAGRTGESTCPMKTLPHEVLDAVRRIHAGGPFPYPRSDGAVFTNREGHLPKQRRGFYHEYTVLTPRARDRSTRRLVTGGTPLTHPAQYFYTGDHYDSFCLVADAGEQQ